jgi:transglutaminase-like putative cysteine protease
VDRDSQIPAHFFRHAWREALRYGDDDWVFVRELIQNARDARASEIRLDIGTSEHLESLSCSDDGSGMDEATIRDHLTRLFSSTKNDRNDGTVGRFGVGFWSVLRFRPSEIVVDSVHESGAHALTIDVVHRRATVSASRRADRGTTITLTRPRGSDDPHALVDVLRAKVRHYAGPVTGIGGQPPPSLVVVGVRVNEELAVGGLVHRPFIGPGFQGAIALSSTPTIRLYARGLLVREASSLEEILPRKGVTSRDNLPGLHVSTSVNADDLEVLLDRQHVVESPTLERIVDGIDRTATRLQRDVLERLAPLPPLSRAFSALRRKETAFGLLFIAMLVVAGFGGARLAESILPPRTLTQASSAGSGRHLGTKATHVESPRIDTATDPSTPAWAFRYEGPDGLLFRVGTLAVHDEAHGLVRSTPQGVRGYRFASRDDDGDPTSDARTVTVVTTAEGPDALVLPVPPGHRVIARSVTVDGEEPADLRETLHGEPLLSLGTGIHDVAYATRAVLDPESPMRAALPVLTRPPPTIPSAFATILDDVRKSDVETRISAVTDAVRNHVRYSTDPLDATLFARSTLPFLERVARFGAGDCDVQNGTLVLLMRSVGVPARLAVGLVGERGRVARDFHAWAEVFDGEAWRMLDVSPVRPRVDDAPAVSGTAVADTSASASPPGLTRASSPTVTRVDEISAPDPALRARESPPASTVSTSHHETLAPATRPLPSTRAPTTTGADRATRVLATWLAPLILALAGAVLLFKAVARRRRRRVTLDDDVAARVTETLLARAASAPADQHDRLDLRRRRMLPTTRARRASLVDVDLALLDARACVALPGTVPPLALPRDALVLDASSPIVRRLVDTLHGLVDLSAVGRALADAAPAAVTRVERALASHSPTMRVLLVDGVSTGVLAHPETRVPHIAAIGRDAPAVRRALDERDTHVSAFLIADHLFARTTAFLDVKDDVLSSLAREVLP